MPPELLKSGENLPSIDNELSADLLLNPKGVNVVMDAQSRMLTDLRSSISRKLLFTLEEKLKNQKQELEKLLGLDKSQTENLSKYTFVLDSQYFEQKFIE